ncbi:PfkB family carbohydrate kinase [Paraburkholderia fungorum]|uniref:PfkB family carbohydrate kinase n=1 Tax=Paraburkholderia fungorum TaxID=134537 RepID=UPI00402BED79
MEIKAEVVLRFGMLEGTAKVTADRCVYDPQSAFGPEPFRANGSTANHLAIVGNRSEVLAMAGVEDPAEAARALLAQGAEVVVVKSGPAGAIVVTREGESVVPAYRTDQVWTVGTGDVFAAIFAARWGVHRENPEYAAELASLAVANYVETMGLPSPLPEQLKASESLPAVTKPGKVYLAGPFFTLSQRWLVDEACRGLRELGLDVFSPIHDIGPGPAEVVGPADIEALLTCDRVFAILDGTDSGTVFEVGYARSKNIPVYALAQSVSDEELKMIVGTECRVFGDFVTAMHHTAWRT